MNGIKTKLILTVLAITVLGFATGAFAQQASFDGDLRTVITLFEPGGGEVFPGPEFLPIYSNHAALVTDIISVPPLVSTPEVMDIDVDGSISNEGQAPMLVILFMGTPAEIKASPWKHMILRGIVNPGEKRTYRSMLVTGWESKAAKFILQAYEDETFAYLSVFSKQEIEGDTDGMDMYTLFMLK